MQAILSTFLLIQSLVSAFWGGKPAFGIGGTIKNKVTTLAEEQLLNLLEGRYHLLFIPIFDQSFHDEKYVKYLIIIVAIVVYRR